MERTDSLIPSVTPAEVINALTTEYINVYSLNLQTDAVQVYRFAGQAVGVLENIHQERKYQDVMQSYITQNVLTEDQNMMTRMTARDKIVQELSRKDVYIVHYRVRRKGEIHYYFMKCVRIGEPSSFSNVILAFANEDAEARHSSAVQDAAGRMGSSAKRKILIVEDKPYNRETLQEILGETYTIIEAVDGLDGLEKLRRYYRELSLILLDAHMPRMDGYEFLDEMRQDVILSSVPVIVVQSARQAGDEERWLSLGASDFIAKPYNPNVTRRRVASIIRLRESAATLHAIEFDDLTGVYTKRAFFHHAEMLLKQNPNTRYDMVLSDIENFKHVNERYGNSMGDEVLRRMGAAFNLLEGDVLCGRYNGDQFVLMTPAFNGEEIYYKDILKEFRNSLPVGNVVVKFGIYENVEHNVPVTVLCDRMQMALQTVKHQYGKIAARYDDTLKFRAMQELLIEESMQRALAEEQFLVYYQPKHDLHTDRTGGAEALVRWDHPELGFMSPAKFISLFEKNGFITALDKYIWKQVCRTLAQWRETNRRLVPISVNLSRRDFEQPDLARWLIETADSYDVDHSLLHVEITESCYADNPESVTVSVNELHEAGFQIEMDDFGTGYSSLSSLSSMPLDVLKLDMSILQHDDPDSDRNVLEYIMQLAKIMRLKTVQEGVETKEQLERIKSLGCDFAQGYLYAKPLSRSEFEAYLTLY